MSTSPADRHQELASRFVEIAALDEHARTEELKRLRAQDPSFADELAALLRQDTTPGLLDQSIDQLAIPIGGIGDVPAPSRTIGAFEIAEEIGRGGMGVVYRARQKDPQRDVALKLVRSSVLAPEAARRLRHEAGILARLTHPNIAQVYDAGTVEDRGTEVSYFAMEFVQGASITSIKDRAVRDRVLRMIDVCEAVHHAHQRGVIHRDIKPANILIDDDGRPRVLDFGIARLIEADVQVTSAEYGSGSLVGTLAYMSPEQLDGRDDLIDTRSDVYALGAVLYELLTGRPPVASAGRSIAEAVHAIRTEHVTAPSRLAPSLPRDLETVIMKAIDRDIERRYGSASDLAADLRRALANEPIEARPPTFAYHASRFVRRNPGLCVIASIAAVLTLVAVGAIAYGYTESERRANVLAAANKEIAQETDRAIAVNEFLRRMLVSADPLGETGAGRADMTILEMLDRESGQIEQSFAGVPESEASVRSTIGSVYLSLGVLDKAEAQFRRSLDLSDQIWGVDSEDADRARRDLAVLLAQTDRTDEASAMFREMLRRQVDSGRDDSLEHAITAIRFSAILLNNRGFEEAQQWLGVALPIVEREADTREDLLPTALNNMARALSGQRKRREAEDLYLRAREAFAASNGPDHPTVAIADGNIAALQYARGDLEGAIERFRRVLDALLPIMGEQNPRIAITRYNLSFALFDQGAMEESLAEIERAAETYGAIYGADHPETLSTRMIAAETRLRAGNADAAGEEFAELAKRWTARDPDSPSAREARFWQARCWVEQGRGAEGIEQMREAYDAYIVLPAHSSRTAQRLLRTRVEVCLDQGMLDHANELAGGLDPASERNQAVIERARTASSASPD